MRTRAAVALQAGKPLEVMEVNLEGPKEGEVLVEIKATGICHTDEFTLSGADPEAVSLDLGARGGRHRVGSGRRRNHAKARRSCDPALYARMPAMPLVPVGQNES